MTMFHFKNKRPSPFAITNTQWKRTQNEENISDEENGKNNLSNGEIDEKNKTRQYYIYQASEVRTALKTKFKMFTSSKITRG